MYCSADLNGERQISDRSNSAIAIVRQSDNAGAHESGSSGEMHYGNSFSHNACLLNGTTGITRRSGA